MSGTTISDLPARPAPRTSVAVGMLAAILVAQAVTLGLMGQPPICACGTVRLWQGVIASPENSQQLTDWYSPSHVIHGFLFYTLLRLAAPRLPVAWRLVLALGLEVSWELLENSPIIIERYRQQALAAGYSGDSILNSVSDSLCMVAGFILAWRLRPWQSIALVVAAEMFTGLMVRDNLTLNVVQLIHPSPAISAWQSAR
jgi:Protein of unknown function (DUF2585)